MDESSRDTGGDTNELALPTKDLQFWSPGEIGQVDSLTVADACEKIAATRRCPAFAIATPAVYPMSYDENPTKGAEMPAILRWQNTSGSRHWRMNEMW